MKKIIETEDGSLYNIDSRIVKVKEHGLGMVSLLFDGDRFNEMWYTRWIRNAGQRMLVVEDTKTELLRITGIILTGGDRQ